MTIKTMFLGSAAALALGSGAALADPALIFDLGGKFDKSFNESSYNGAERWAAETGNSYGSVELQSDAQRDQAIRRFADEGYNPVIMAGFSNATPLEAIAPDYPDTTFVIIDAEVDQPNVRSIMFDEHEGSYLVGVLAAMASETDVVGFVGGMDIPLIRRFGCGYAQGVMETNPEATVLVNFTGTTPSAWNDPVKGSELTLAQIAQGADVVYAAAGATGVGVLQTAADQGVYSIGVDANQNYLHPGSVLTSMVKRVDNAVFDAMTEGADMSTGLITMGIANDGVAAAMDEYNESIITDEMREALAAATAAIAAGEVDVHDYYTDQNCPSAQF